MANAREHEKQKTAAHATEDEHTAGHVDPHATQAAGNAAVNRIADHPQRSIKQWAAELQTQHKAKKDAAVKDVPDFGSYNPWNQEAGVKGFLAFVAERHKHEVIQGSSEHTALLLQIEHAFESLNLYQRQLAKEEISKLVERDPYLRPRPMSYYNIETVLGVIHEAADPRLHKATGNATVMLGTDDVKRPDKEWSAEDRARYQVLNDRLHAKHQAAKEAAVKGVPDLGSYNPWDQQDGIKRFLAFVEERRNCNVTGGSPEHSAVIHQIEAAYNSLNYYQQYKVKEELARRAYNDPLIGPLSYYQIQIIVGVIQPATYATGKRG